MFEVNDPVLIDSPVADSAFKGKKGYVTEKVGKVGYMVYVRGFGDYFTTERWLTKVEGEVT